MVRVKKPFHPRRPTFIKEWRVFRNLTQDRVAERIGVSRENYGRIESGKVPYNQDFLEICADALACTSGDLLSRNPLTETMVDKLRALVQKASAADQERVFKIAKSLLENNG